MAPPCKKHPWYGLGDCWQCKRERKTKPIINGPGGSEGWIVTMPQLHHHFRKNEVQVTPDPPWWKRWWKKVTHGHHD